MHIPLHQLHFGPNVPAGMDWSVIGMHHVYLRKTSEPCNPPSWWLPAPVSTGV